MQTPRRAARPWPVVGWLLLLVLIVGLSWVSHGVFQLGAFHDDSKYFLLARSILGADAYGVHTGYAGAVRHPYPFGFPLLLMPLADACPDRWDCLTLLPLATTLINVTLLFFGWGILSGTRSPWWALAVAAGYALHPWTIVQTNMVLSEPVFTTFSLGALIVTEQCARTTRPPTARLVLLGWLLAWVGFTRSAGIVLWPVAAVRVLWRAPDVGRRVAALAIGLALLLLPVVAVTSVSLSDLVPYQYVESMISPSLRDRDPAEDSFSFRFTHGVDAYATQYVRQSAFPFGGGEQERALGRLVGIDDLPRVLGVGASLIILVGALAHPRVGLSVLGFEAAHMLLHVFWYARDTRLLYPIQPFLFFQLLVGIRTLLQLALPQRRPARAGIGMADRIVAGLVLALVAASIVRSARPHPPSIEHTRDYRTGTDWLRQHSPPDAVIMAAEPATIHLYAQRTTMPVARVNSTDELRAALADAGVDYVLIAPFGAWSESGQLEYAAKRGSNFLPQVRELIARGELELVYESEPREKVLIYRVANRRSGQGTGSG